MNLPICLGLLLLALDLGGAHKPVDFEIRKLKRKFRNMKKDVQTISTNLTQITANTMRKIQNLTEETVKNQDKIKDNIRKLNNLTGKVESLNNPLYMFVCGYDNFIINFTNQVVNYQRTTINHDNIRTSGGFDLSSGNFTAPTKGIYLVSYSTNNRADSGDSLLVMFLRINGRPVFESFQFSYYTGPSGSVYEGFGRELPIYLDSGETLDLYCDICPGPLYYTTFCITLIKEDDGSFSGLEMARSLDEIEEDPKMINQTKHHGINN